MIKIIGNDFEKEKFDDITNHPLQSWEWGEARKEMDIEVLRIGESVNNQISKVYQLTFHKIPYFNFKIGYLPKSHWPSKQTLEFLYDYAKKHNVIFIKIEPNVSKSQIQSADRRTKSQLNLNFQIVKSKHPLFPEWTQILDLGKTEDELLKGFKSKTRYNINLAVRKGITVKEMSNEEGFKIFSDLYFETCRRQKYFGHTLNYHRIVWKNLKKNIAHLLIAFYGKIPLAAYELYYFNKTFYYPYGGTSLEYRNFMASNLLMWEAIKLGKKLGAEKFDMWGSLPPNFAVDHAWAGFTKFKEGYGGRFVEFAGSFDLLINKNLYNLYGFLHGVRNFYFAIKRLL